MEGDLAKGPARLLLLAAGSAENTDMKWEDGRQGSVGRHWGQAPSVVEGVAGDVTLPVPAERVRVWVLNECGRRQAELPVKARPNGRTVVSIGPQQRTLWYEIEVK